MYNIKKAFTLCSRDIRLSKQWNITGENVNETTSIKYRLTLKLHIIG
jgi:hypothetical protein